MKKIWIQTLLFLLFTLVFSFGNLARAEDEGTWVPALNDRVPPITDSEYKAVFGDRMLISKESGLVSPSLWGVHVDVNTMRMNVEAISNDIRLEKSSLVGVFFEKQSEDVSWTLGLDYYSMSSSIRMGYSEITFDYEFLVIPLRLKLYWNEPKRRSGTFFTFGVSNSFLQSAKLRPGSTNAILTKNGQVKSELDISSDCQFWNRQGEVGTGYSFVLSEKSAFQVYVAYNFSSLPLTAYEGHNIYLSGWNLGVQFLF